jgi:ribonuclease III
MAQYKALQEFQNLIGVQFRNEGLLRQALTHRSYLNEQPDPMLEDNERMEFLGDAVLDFIVGDMLYTDYPNMAEGELTRLRAALVRTEALAELAKDCNIGQFIYMGKGEENSGGRERTNNLCRAFEAVIGAVYLDQGLEVVREFIAPRLDALKASVIEEALDKDARSRLQEWSQATLNITPTYRTLSTSGPDHAKEFLVEAIIGDQVVATGSGRSKQAGAQAAAQAALQLVKEGRFPLNTD